LLEVGSLLRALPKHAWNKEKYVCTNLDARQGFEPWHRGNKDCVVILPLGVAHHLVTQTLCWPLMSWNTIDRMAHATAYVMRSTTTTGSSSSYLNSITLGNNMAANRSPLLVAIPGTGQKLWCVNPIPFVILCFQIRLQGK
jgi:hypothetical protein